MIGELFVEDISGALFSVVASGTNKISEFKTSVWLSLSLIYYSWPDFHKLSNLTLVSVFTNKLSVHDLK